MHKRIFSKFEPDSFYFPCSTTRLNPISPMMGAVVAAAVEDDHTRCAAIKDDI